MAKPGGGQAVWHNRKRDNRAIEMLQFESKAITFLMLRDNSWLFLVFNGSSANISNECYCDDFKRKIENLKFLNNHGKWLGKCA